MRVSQNSNTPTTMCEQNKQTTGGSVKYRVTAVKILL